jgi:FixJ family two-component response regulator
MTDQNFSVFLVDDDPAVLKALGRLLNTKGYKTQAFTSPNEFLKAHDALAPGCAVLDLAMPELDGFALQNKLAAQGGERQVIFLSGRGDIPKSVRAMRAGAVDFLQKPVKSADLLAAVGRAADRDSKARHVSDEHQGITDRVNHLTPREFEVLTYVIAGRLNKQIAGELGTVEKTVKVHRSRMMVKMGVRTVAELVRLTETIKLRPHATPHNRT